MTHKEIFNSTVNKPRKTRKFHISYKPPFPALQNWTIIFGNNVYLETNPTDVIQYTTLDYVYLVTIQRKPS